MTSDTDKYDGTAPVTLMTVHSAKGLEFPIVFLVGLEDGIFPHSRSVNDPKELEEERRLAYVAITRAEKLLYISHAMRRRTYGEDMASEPSQFLNELPIELIEDLSQGSSWLKYARGSTLKRAAGVGESNAAPVKPKNPYAGKTYNNAEAIAEFFRDRSAAKSVESPARNDRNEERPVNTPPKVVKVSKPLMSPPKAQASSSIVPGAYVLHEKYGRGLVLRREGSGESSKLTVSFPGFGQKKLIEKFANLQKL